MILKEFVPHLSLKEYVRCYRIVHFQFGEMSEAVLKAYAPRPEVCLHFFLRERELVQLGNGPKKDYKFPIVLAGQLTSVINRYLQGKDFITFNIVFHPTAVFRLTGIPSFELTDNYLDAENVFSKSIRSVFDQLQNAISYEQMTVVADKFVNALARNTRKDAHRLDEVSRFMIDSGGKGSVDWLADKSCLSPKQFTRKFYERTGVNPKTYMRIIRFNKAVNIKNAYPHRDWLDIAFECGYVDYQHLVKDYKDFTNYTPNVFHLIESKSPESRLGLASEIYKRRAESSLVLA
jgi:AraC-like DNA-binding protein